ncbi:MAG: hypothetical protein HY579_02835 [Nitrospinae bacterium]|nr:hypothetical protein [Nitrospinota bacterium]
MMRLAIFGLLVLALVLLIRSFFPPSPGKERIGAATEMVKDPNCETYIPKTEAVVRTLRGATHYFCSEKCAEEFSRTS